MEGAFASNSGYFALTRSINPALPAPAVNTRNRNLIIASRFDSMILMTPGLSISNGVELETLIMGLAQASLSAASKLLGSIMVSAVSNIGRPSTFFRMSGISFSPSLIEALRSTFEVIFVVSVEAKLGAGQMYCERLRINTEERSISPFPSRQDDQIAGISEIDRSVSLTCSVNAYLMPA